MNVNINNFLIRAILNIIHHYNHEKYWRMRKEVVNPYSRVPILLRYYYLLKIKRMDAFNNASMGTDLGNGAQFKSPPWLHHGLNGIIIGHDVKIGKNCTIHQQVTIMNGVEGKSVEIGDNCMIGAGAKILNGVHIGDNVKIGANAVVVSDIPSNCTAVGVPARIIENKK